MKNKKSLKKEAKYIKNLYEDFKEVTTEVLGDTGKFIKNHKSLLIIAFILYLLFRNKQFTIKNFVNQLEDKIRGDKEW